MRRVENPCTRLCSGIGSYHLKPETIDINNAPPKTLKTIAKKKRDQYNIPSLILQARNTQVLLGLCFLLSSLLTLHFIHCFFSQHKDKPLLCQLG